MVGSAVQVAATMLGAPSMQHLRIEVNVGATTRSCIFRQMLYCEANADFVFEILVLAPA